MGNKTYGEKLEEIKQRERIECDEITLRPAMLGYEIVVNNLVVGNIEGTPGTLEYIRVEPFAEGKGVARSAIQEFAFPPPPWELSLSSLLVALALLIFSRYCVFSLFVSLLPW